MFSCPTFKKVEFIDLLVNAPYYGHLLNVHGVIGFKKIHITEAQQQELCRRIGDFAKWVPNTNNPTPITEPYYETLELELQNKKPKQKLVCEWSMGITRQPPSVGSVLNNVVFQCDKKHGSTLLIDMRKVFNLLKEEFKQFARQVVWVEVATGISRQMVEKHRNTNQEILIFSTEFNSESGEDKRYKFFVDGEEINKEQRLLLQEIFDQIVDIIYICNLNILEEWKWEEKDLLIVDDSCMFQATKSGFKYGSRIIHKQICTDASW
jgi:alpha-ketoglutarate-dependent taurine dioxygenase